VSVGRDLISRVTDAVLEDVRAWQRRPLDDLYPVLFLDAFVVKIRDGGSVQRKACYLALGVSMDGSRDVLGMCHRGFEVLDAGAGAPRGPTESNGGERPSSPGRRSGWVEAEGSPIRETPPKGNLAHGVTVFAVLLAYCVLVFVTVAARRSPRSGSRERRGRGA
jgi:Transposase, Mutator family